MKKYIPEIVALCMILFMLWYVTGINSKPIDPCAQKDMICFSDTAYPTVQQKIMP